VRTKSVYNRFLNYVLTAEQLEDNNFPTYIKRRLALKSEKEKSRIEFMDKESTENLFSKEPRDCSRCHKTFSYAEVSQSCLYHPGPLYFKRDKLKGIREFRYACCCAVQDMKGCRFSNYHVWENSNPDYSEFVCTEKRPLEKQEGACRVFALDCEMCYTRKGSELARITILDEFENLVYDKLVLPAEEIIDYNTEFSGITSELLENVTVRIEDVQRELLEFIFSDTILVGHSLENDLLALKMCHELVIDTSILFPHPHGKQ
jgi:RNA exonuclease 1